MSQQTRHIAQRAYNDAEDWDTIYDANKQVIGNNPNLIKPGQVLQIPTQSDPSRRQPPPTPHPAPHPTPAPTPHPTPTPTPTPYPTPTPDPTPTPHQKVKMMTAFWTRSSKRSGMSLERRKKTDRLLSRPMVMLEAVWRINYY